MAGVFFLLLEGGVWKKVTENLVIRSPWAHPLSQGSHMLLLSSQPTLQFQKLGHFMAPGTLSNVPQCGNVSHIGSSSKMAGF